LGVGKCHRTVGRRIWGERKKRVMKSLPMEEMLNTSWDELGNLLRMGHIAPIKTAKRGKQRRFRQEEIPTVYRNLLKGKHLGKKTRFGAARFIRPTTTRHSRENIGGGRLGIGRERAEGVHHSKMF